MSVIAPASAEVAEEHVSRHACDAGIEQPVICSCGAVTLITCARCGEPLLLVTQPGREMCGCGREILALAKVPGPWAHWRTWPGVGQ